MSIKRNTKALQQRGKKWGFRGRVQRFKTYILSALKAQQRKGKKKGTKQEKSRSGNSSHILEIIQNIT